MAALTQPIATASIGAIRWVECAPTVESLRNRGLIARSSHLGTHREKLRRTTQRFLDEFGLVSIDEFYKDGRMEEVFATVYSGEMSEAVEEDHGVVEGNPEPA